MLFFLETSSSITKFSLNFSAPQHYRITISYLYLGGGIWTPPSPQLSRIRDYSADNARAWARRVNSKKVREAGGIKGDSLKRPPRGFDAEHVHIEDLKRKSFYVMSEADASVALQADFIDEVTEAFRRAAPLNRFITGALDLPF